MTPHPRNNLQQKNKSEENRLCLNHRRAIDTLFLTFIFCFNFILCYESYKRLFDFLWCEREQLSFWFRYTGYVKGLWGV